MAEHADASEEQLNKEDHPPISATPPGHSDGRSPSPNGAATEERDVAAAPASEQPAETSDEQIEEYDLAVNETEASEDAAPVKKPMSPVRLAAVFGIVAIVALGGLVGWLGFRAHQSHQVQQRRELLVQVGRQGALNLTTVDWHHAEADIQRILDSSTGAFYDDFSNRSKPFLEVVKKVQSKSVGTITEAGLESQSDNEAQVLVAVTVKTTDVNADEQEPRHWRMRITVQKLGNEAKVSNVAFVP